MPDFEDTPRAETRKITEDADVQAAAVLIAQELGDVEEPDPKTIAQIREQFTELDELQVGVFDASNSLIGVGGLMNAGRLAELKETSIVDVATSPEHRREGVGSQVITALEDIAREQGLETLNVPGATEAGGELYTALGFEWDAQLEAYRKQL